MNKKDNPDSLQSNQAENSNSSSTLRALEQFKKETEKKELAEETMRTRCKICFKEIAPRRLCGGHGGGGGGGGGSGGGDSSADDAANDDAQLSGDTLMPASSSEFMDELFDMDSVPAGVLTPDSFNPEIIAELIAQGLLNINSDRNSLTLSISLLCDPDLLTKEQQTELSKYMNAVLKELAEFKKEHNISMECVSMVKNEQGIIVSLQITLPTLALYDQFIQRLANNLIPKPQLTLQETKESTKRPSPLSMEPQPQKGEEKDEKPFNPSPFSLELKPKE